MSVICVISARGGSQGLPGKNIRQLLGKPLIAWSIEQALSTPEINRVVVSTDSVAIADIAKQYGADVPFLRPQALSTSESGKFQVWKHALSACQEIYNEEYELYIDLDCTNPLRDIEDISFCIKQFRERSSHGVDAVFSVCEARKNPYFNMLELDKAGALKICKSLDGSIIRRQDAPDVFEHVASIYALDPAYIKRASFLLEGHTEGYNIGIAKSLDVDSDFDFDLIEYLMEKKHQQSI